MQVVTTVRPSRTWEKPESHYIHAMSNEWYQSLLLIQDEINHSTFKFFRNQGIYSVSLPLTTGSVTSPMGLGSDSLPVKVNLEGVDTYLADSMQFHLEYALRNLSSGVHYVMPTFRGELADERHLCQFYHSEAEISGTLEDVIDLVNKYIHQLCVDLLENKKDVIEKIAGDTNHIEYVLDLNGNIPRITLEQAVLELGNNPEYVRNHDEGFRTITNQGEQELIKRFGGIVWLTHHDYLSVPFYQAKDESGKYALNADLLFGIGEVVGSGERHTDANELLSAMIHHQVNPSEYEWYVNMKALAPIKSAGFGMGVERFILWLLKHNDIRDCQMIPRFNGSLIMP